MDDIDFVMPDDPYDEIFMGIPEEPPDLFPPTFEAFIPDDAALNVPFEDIPGYEQDGLQSRDQTFVDDAWRWHDARLIGVEREAGYEIGMMDVYANLDTGDLGGSYLPLATFDDVSAATAYHLELEDTLSHQRWMPDEMIAYLEGETSDPEWRSASAAEYAAYEQVCGLGEWDDPEADLVLEEALRLGGVVMELPDPTQAALDDIGVRIDHFDPSEPPAIYDAETDTTYWVGVFQPEASDRTHCITSILSMTPDGDGGYDAQLAPCAVGDWDTAYANAEFLIEKAREGGVDRLFDAAEAMARGAQQHELWETERGVPLEVSL